MNYIPCVSCAPCPRCKTSPEVKIKLFAWECRMVCKCGISGAWVKYDPNGNPWNHAIAGWPFVEQRSEPPPPRR